MKKTVLLFGLMLATAVSFAKDIKTVQLTTNPQMHCENCEKKIKGNLRFEKGVKKISTSIPEQTITIEYDADKTSVEKLIKAFPKFGYKASEVKKDKRRASQTSGKSTGGQAGR